LIAVVAVTGAGELAEKLEDFPLWLFVPVFLLKCVNWVLRYVEWRYFLGVIGVRTVRGYAVRPEPSPDRPTVRERDSAVLWLAGLTMAVSPGKLAEVLKALVLKNLSGLEFSRGAPVIFLERLVDGLAVIPLTTVAMLAVSGSLDTGDLSISYIGAVLLGTTIMLGVMIAVVQHRPLALWLLAQAARLPLLRRIESVLHNLYESSYELIKLRHLVPTTLLGAGAYLTDSIGFYLMLTGLGLDASWTLFGQATFILGFSVIIASLSTMPGGAGGREITVGAMLTGVVGLTKTDAGTATFLISIFQVWAGVLLGLVVIALFRNTLFPPALEAEIEAYEVARQAH
jgi:uncharacterized protein (TIRG00374 family)